jgi:hypothetical protein
MRECRGACGGKKGGKDRYNNTLVYRTLPFLPSSVSKNFLLSCSVTSRHNASASGELSQSQENGSKNEWQLN